MLKLSIIVPIYKVEPYLRKCVDSLLLQDLLQDEYEIILADDGSTDGSGKLVDEVPSSSFLRRREAIVKVIHLPNSALNAVRNSGLFVAEGLHVIDYMTRQFQISQCAYARHWGRNWVKYSKKYMFSCETNHKIKQLAPLSIRLWHAIYCVRKWL